MIIEIEQQYDRVCILHCQGRLVPGPEVKYLHTKMGQIRELECTKMLADFQEVTAIGSIGVDFIVCAYDSVVRQPGARFVLAGANRHVRRVLDLTRLSTLIVLASDLSSGLTILRAEAPMAFSRRASANLNSAGREWRFDACGLRSI